MGLLSQSRCLSLRDNIRGKLVYEFSIFRDRFDPAFLGHVDYVQPLFHDYVTG